jgi:hypothetical protein
MYEKKKASFFDVIIFFVVIYIILISLILLGMKRADDYMLAAIETNQKEISVIEQVTKDILGKYPEVNYVEEN